MRICVNTPDTDFGFFILNLLLKTRGVFGRSILSKKNNKHKSIQIWHLFCQWVVNWINLHIAYLIFMDWFKDLKYSLAWDFIFHVRIASSKYLLVHEPFQVSPWIWVCSNFLPDISLDSLLPDSPKVIPKIELYSVVTGTFFFLWNLLLQTVFTCVWVEGTKKSF